MSEKDEVSIKEKMKRRAEKAIKDYGPMMAYQINQKLDYDYDPHMIGSALGWDDRFVGVGGNRSRTVWGLKDAKLSHPPEQERVH